MLTVMNNEDKNWYMPALIFYGKVTGWIVLPLLVAYFLTHSLIGILVAFVCEFAETNTT
jgi:hypothetical protein